MKFRPYCILEKRVYQVNSITTCKHKYLNASNPNEKYITIVTEGTKFLHSLVTFKAVGIPDAPVMVVNTSDRDTSGHIINVRIYLPRSVDEWEIKYYSKYGDLPPLTDEYLKCAGVANLEHKFGKEIDEGEFLELELRSGQFIHRYDRFTWPRWSIPEV